MKDLKIYYQFSEPFEGINPDFDRAIEKLAKKQGLQFMGSGVEIGKGIRDIHYGKKEESGK